MMNRKLVWIGGILLVGMLVAGCAAGATETTPELPEAPTETTDEPIEATNEPTEAPTEAPTDAASILAGTWIDAERPDSRGANVMDFTEDGEWRWGHGLSMLLNRLDKAANATVRFDGMQMIVVEDHTTCYEAEGAYNVILLDNGNIRFEPLLEDCIARAEFLKASGNHEWTRYDPSLFE